MTELEQLIILIDQLGVVASKKTLRVIAKLVVGEQPVTLENFKMILSKYQEIKDNG